MTDAASLTHKMGELERPFDAYLIIETDLGFKQLSTIPDQTNVEDIYSDNYSGGPNPNWIQKTIDEKPYWELVFSDRYDVFERFVSTPQKRILDIGSFLGIFLEVGQKRGWEVLGIEPSKGASAYSEKQGIPVKTGLFETFSDTELGCFDVINLSLTLEHLRDPIETLNRAYTCLKPGGLVCVEVPNDYSPLQAAVKSVLNTPDYWYAPPHHINYFNFDSLQATLTHCGFNVVHKLATFPMEFFLLMGDVYLGNESIGHQCHQKRMTFETNLSRAGMSEFKNRLYEFFAKEGVGREVILFGQKPR